MAKPRNEPVRWRWGRNGAIMGAIVVLADLLLGWRGAIFLPWTTPSLITSNAVQMVAMVSLPALIGLVAGIFADKSRNRL